MKPKWWPKPEFPSIPQEVKDRVNLQSFADRDLFASGFEEGYLQGFKDSVEAAMEAVAERLLDSGHSIESAQIFDAGGPTDRHNRHWLGLEQEAK